MQGTLSTLAFKVMPLVTLLLFTDFLDLTLADVGTCIELVYTPVRIDGMKGTPSSLLSDIVGPGKHYCLFIASDNLSNNCPLRKLVRDVPN